MVYPYYFVCLLLMLPAFGLTAVVSFILLFAAGPKAGWSVIINFLAFFGAGIAEPLHYGWRILALLATLGFLTSAGAIPQLRTLCFYGLGVLGSLCIAFCLYVATREGSGETFTALFVLSPSLLGIVACAWFATKFA